MMDTIFAVKAVMENTVHIYEKYKSLPFTRNFILMVVSVALYSTLVAVLGLIVWVGAAASKDLIVQQQYSAEREAKEMFSYDTKVKDMEFLKDTIIRRERQKDTYDIYESKKELEEKILEIAEIEKQLEFVSADRGSTIARAYYVKNKILIVGYSFIVMFALLNFIEFFSTLNNYIAPKKNA